MKPRTQLSPLFAVGLSPDRVSQLAGAGPVRGKVPAIKSRIQVETQQAIVRMKQRGMSVKAICSELGLSRAAVYSYLPNLVP